MFYWHFNRVGLILYFYQMAEISDKLQSFHDNYLSAKEMISSSEGSATKTVQFLPVFRRLFPAASVEQFNTNKKSLEQSESSRYCLAQCPRNDSQNQCISTIKLKLRRM